MIHVSKKIYSKCTGPSTQTFVTNHWYLISGHSVTGPGRYTSFIPFMLSPLLEIGIPYVNLLSF